MVKVFNWLLALACGVAVVIGIGFYRPEWLPKPVHAELLKYKLAAPLPEIAATAGTAPRPGAPAPAGGGGAGQRPVAVEAAKVRVGPVTASLTAVGSLRADESVTVATEIDGRISEVVVREGIKVEAGDVLFRLDDQMAKAELAQAKAEFALAEANYDRADTLFKQKSGTERTRDETRYALDRTRANVELAASRLDKTTIRAAFGGVVGLSAIGVGEYVTKGRALIVLSRVDPIKVDFRLPEVELGNVKVGSRIRVEVDALPGRKFEGEVYAIDPQVDVNGRALQLRARIANAGGELKSGLFARVELITASHPEAITIPETALVNQGRERFVYIVRDGKAVRSKVVTGLRLTGRVEVLEGVGPQDVVVVSGQQRLRDGVPVEIVGTGPTS
ncbi:efflux RND transporter periplasmic adaptor subunit [Prosthecomicrobium hirschii]|uniref:efflux RND transporter periplasmic adaptor subunit n=1 Tax=Prosthecodimorpha hirschii TaxID=665126 RepID=UPI0022206890|nr:efflux RND transporter periplasmic adaptor subunit [Prosthecomicrobium hirschii]MCW1841187.1 efflux RND transporter periplasmic adaptor subunit [Prosthecomicrobium hirschii]